MKRRSAFTTALLTTLLLAVPVESDAFFGFFGGGFNFGFGGGFGGWGGRAIGEVPATIGIAPTTGTGTVPTIGRSTGVIATPTRSTA